MDLIVSILLSLCILFSSFNPFTPLTFSMAKEANKETTAPVIENPVTDTVVQPVEDTTEEETSDYKIKNLIDMDFEGYCTMSVPLSHFRINDGSSNNVLKNLTYKDDKTRLTCSYITNIAVDADIPGYITQEVAGVDTVTNGKTEEIYGNEVKWMKVPSTTKEKGCNVYVWYTLNPNKSAAFWVKAKVAPESDDEEFYEVIKKMFNTYNYYQYGSGTIFETPSTGYYADATFNDGTVGNTSNYKANDKANTVFQTRGGYVEGADISADWEDLEIIIDGHKFKLPCKMSDFYNAGYKVNDLSLRESDLKVYPTNTFKAKLINDNGTVVSVTVLNDSASDKKHIDECQLVTILVDRRDFVSMADTDILEDTESEVAEGEITESIESTEDENNSDDTKSVDTNTTYSSTEENNEEDIKSDVDTSEESEEDTEESNDDTGESESEDSNTTEDDDEDTEDDKDDDDETQQTGNITDNLDKDKNFKDHEVIIAGGVTWGVFTEDAVAYFGKESQRIRWDGDSKYKLVWQSGEKRMSIIIGVLNTITSVEISCNGYDS